MPTVMVFAWNCCVTAMKRLLFILVLRPLIRRNYRLRAAGVLPDEWYWADRLALKWGFWVELR